MKCWICHSTAESREHIPKASDLRLVFGQISPDEPVFYNSEDKTNIRLKSAKTNRVKTGIVLCRRCNDTRTAPHDGAWEQLSRVMFERWPEIKSQGRLKLQRFFPGSVRSLSLNVHLYFVKLFGCRIVEDKIPIPIGDFSEAILRSHSHPNLFLTFCYRTIMSETAFFAGASEVQVKDHGRNIEVASWYYTVGELDVQVTWFRDTPLRNIPGAWHPDRGGKILKFRGR